MIQCGNVRLRVALNDFKKYNMISKSKGGGCVGTSDGISDVS